MKDTEKRIWDFLSVDIPSGGSERFRKWQEDCRNLGQHGPAVFLEALKDGSETQQNVAVIALRYFGYKSKAEGFGKERIYKVLPPGSTEWTTIVPKNPPDRPY